MAVVAEYIITDYADIYKTINTRKKTDDFEYNRMLFLETLPYVDYYDQRYYPTIKPLDFVSVPKESIDYLSNAKGIYVLYDCNGECLYVGQSTNLAVRLYQHINGMTNTSSIYEMIDDIKVALCYDDFLREIYETVTINELRPCENREKVFYKRTEV